MHANLFSPSQTNADFKIGNKFRWVGPTIKSALDNWADRMDWILTAPELTVARRHGVRVVFLEDPHHDEGHFTGCDLQDNLQYFVKI